jgi:hypothetical protein
MPRGLAEMPALFLWLNFGKLSYLIVFERSSFHSWKGMCGKKAKERFRDDQ